MNAFAYQAAIAAALPLLIQYAKRWIPLGYVSRASRAISGIAAVATAAGIQWSVSGSGACIVLPEGGAIADWAARAILQYAGQEIVYRTTIARAK